MIPQSDDDDYDDDEMTNSNLVRDRMAVSVRFCVSFFEVLEVCGYVKKEGSLGVFLEKEGTRMSYLQERRVGKKLCDIVTCMHEDHFEKKFRHKIR